jgi:hypothetical protein
VWIYNGDGCEGILDRDEEASYARNMRQKEYFKSSVLETSELFAILSNAG